MRSIFSSSPCQWFSSRVGSPRSAARCSSCIRSIPTRRRSGSLSKPESFSQASVSILSARCIFLFGHASADGPNRLAAPCLLSFAAPTALGNFEPLSLAHPALEVLEQLPFVCVVAPVVEGNEPSAEALEFPV